MGHERIGFLPKTQSWRSIVDEIGSFTISNDVSSVAQNALKNVRTRFEKLDQDPSVKSVFHFLVTLAYAFKQDNPADYLISNKILESSDITPLKLARAINKYSNEKVLSLEYNTFSRQAAVDAIGAWYVNHLPSECNLFEEQLESAAILKKMSNGSGFCELSRLYFAKFTERYLKYFLEREASSVITNIGEREKFNKEIEKHIDKISRHAFETSKITQSFAAGWFNKNTKESVPTERQVKGFLSFAFGKMKSELLREEHN